ncbi:MAG TPA: hypothetical protein VHF26_05385, partial [Trebonia sp.]|nr:hypothetical protein [Trebonia sp.]
PSAGSTIADADSRGDQPPSLLAVVRSERVLLVMLLVTLAANLGSGGMDQVALPALAHGPLRSGASGYGLILAAFGAGALAGTLAAGQIPGFRRPAVTGSLAFLAEAACIAAVPWLGTTVAVAGAMAAIGIANGFGNVLTITAFQRWAAPSLLGRLMGLLLTASFGVFPVSVVLAAFFTRDLGPASFFLFAATTLAAALLAGLTQRSWRDFGACPGRSGVSRAGPGPRGEAASRCRPGRTGPTGCRW